MRSEGSTPRRRAIAWAAAAAFAASGCSRDLSDSAQDGTDAVRAVLAATSDPNQMNRYGDAMVHVAVLRTDPQMLAAVLARGVQVDLRNARNMTALGLAIESQCLACADQLLRAHADPSLPQGKREDRPLHRAAALGSLDLVRLLLAAGADPNAHNATGETPLHAAVANDPYRASAVSRLLIDRGADFTAVDSLGETPVHRAAVGNSPALIEFYASIGADLSAPNAWGATPLDRAIEARHDPAIEVLYRLGARPALTPRFEPPLIAAARSDDVERARWLMAFGADPEKPYLGETAIDVARAGNNDDVVSVLVGPKRRP
jgi:ankyrin repeat protein